MGVPCFVYGLIDPRTLLIRYIGKSTIGMKRPKEHRQRHRQHGGWVSNWVNELIQQGLDYSIVILEECSNTLLNECEMWWIAYARLSEWPLTNLTHGGDDGFPVGQLHYMRRLSPEDLRQRLSKSIHSPLALDRLKSRWTGPGNPNNLPEVQKKRDEYWTDDRRRVVGDRVRALGDSHNMRTDNGRAAASARMHGRWQESEFRDSKSGDNNHMRRREHRERMSGDTNPAKSPEARQKIRDSWTPERRAAHSARVSESNRKRAKKTVV